MLAERVRDTGALALARQQCDGVGARGKRSGPCRQGLLGPAPPGARVVVRSLRCLPLLGRRAPFRFGRARLDEALIQEARGGLRRQVRQRRRAALNERARFGLELAHVPLDARNAAHTVAMVVGVAEGPIPNLERRLGRFDRRLAREPEAAGGDRPSAAPILEVGRRGSVFGFRFLETPARFPEPGLEGARSVPGAGRLLEPPLEAIGQPDGIKTLDLAQSGLAAKRAQRRLDAAELRFSRLELEFGARRACRGSSGNVRRARTIPASAPADLGARTRLSTARANACRFLLAARSRALPRPAPGRTGASVRRAAGFRAHASPAARRPRSRRPPDRSASTARRSNSAT